LRIVGLEQLHKAQIAGLATTNLAYGGPDNRTLYITESDSGSVLCVQLEVPGQTMFSHR